MENSIWNNIYINFEKLRTSGITNDDISERASNLLDISTMGDEFITRQLSLNNGFDESDDYERMEQLIKDIEKEYNILNKVEYKLRNNLVTPGLDKGIIVRGNGWYNEVERKIQRIIVSWTNQDNEQKKKEYNKK